MKDTVKRQLDRRTFFKSAGAAAAGASAIGFPRAATTSRPPSRTSTRTRSRRSSRSPTCAWRPSSGAPMTCPIIRLDTNQGLSGYGEVRDGASATYALFLKSRILGENPCNVDRIFRKIKQFGGHARQAGGVCGVEMALLGPGGQGLRRAGVPDAGRASSATRCGSTPTRPRPPNATRAGQEAQGAHGPGLHVPEAGLRHQPAEGRPGRAHQARGHGLQRAATG